NGAAKLAAPMALYCISSYGFVQTFVRQNLDVDAPVDIASFGIGVGGGGVGCSITGGGQNTSHRHVGRVAQVVGDSSGALVAELLVLGFGSCAGGVACDLDHVVVG